MGDFIYRRHFVFRLNEKALAEGFRACHNYIDAAFFRITLPRRSAGPDSTAIDTFNLALGCRLHGYPLPKNDPEARSTSLYRTAEAFLGDLDSLNQSRQPQRDSLDLKYDDLDRCRDSLAHLLDSIDITLGHNTPSSLRDSLNRALDSLNGIAHALDRSLDSLNFHLLGDHAFEAFYHDSIVSFGFQYHVNLIGADGADSLMVHEAPPWLRVRYVLKQAPRRLVVYFEPVASNIVQTARTGRVVFSFFAERNGGQCLAHDTRFAFDVRQEGFFLQVQQFAPNSHTPADSSGAPLDALGFDFSSDAQAGDFRVASNFPVTIEVHYQRQNIWETSWSKLSCRELTRNIFQRYLKSDDEAARDPFTVIHASIAVPQFLFNMETRQAPDDVRGLLTFDSYGHMIGNPTWGQDLSTAQKRYTFYQNWLFTYYAYKYWPEYIKYNPQVRPDYDPAKHKAPPFDGTMRMWFPPGEYYDFMDKSMADGFYIPRPSANRLPDTDYRHATVTVSAFFEEKGPEGLTSKYYIDAVSFPLRQKRAADDDTLFVKFMPEGYAQYVTDSVMGDYYANGENFLRFARFRGHDRVGNIIFPADTTYTFPAEVITNANTSWSVHELPEGVSITPSSGVVDITKRNERGEFVQHVTVTVKTDSSNAFNGWRSQREAYAEAIPCYREDYRLADIDPDLSAAFETKNSPTGFSCEHNTEDGSPLRRGEIIVKILNRDGSTVVYFPKNLRKVYMDYFDRWTSGSIFRGDLTIDRAAFDQSCVNFASFNQGYGIGLFNNKEVYIRDLQEYDYSYSNDDLYESTTKQDIKNSGQEKNYSDYANAVKDATTQSTVDSPVQEEIIQNVVYGSLIVTGALVTGGIITYATLMEGVTASLGALADALAAAMETVSDLLTQYTALAQEVEQASEALVNAVAELDNLLANGGTGEAVGAAQTAVNAAQTAETAAQNALTGVEQTLTQAQNVVAQAQAIVNSTANTLTATANAATTLAATGGTAAVEAAAAGSQALQTLTTTATTVNSALDAAGIASGVIAAGVGASVTTGTIIAGIAAGIALATVTTLAIIIGAKLLMAGTFTTAAATATTAVAAATAAAASISLSTIVAPIVIVAFAAGAGIALYYIFRWLWGDYDDDGGGNGGGGGTFGSSYYFAVRSADFNHNDATKVMLSNAGMHPDEERIAICTPGNPYSLLIADTNYPMEQSFMVRKYVKDLNQIPLFYATLTEEEPQYFPIETDTLYSPSAVLFGKLLSPGLDFSIARMNKLEYWSRIDTTKPYTNVGNVYIIQSGTAISAQAASSLRVFYENLNLPNPQRPPMSDAVNPIILPAADIEGTVNVYDLRGKRLFRGRESDFDNSYRDVLLPLIFQYPSGQSVIKLTE
jgi:hypothetical protein